MMLLPVPDAKRLPKPSQCGPHSSGELRHVDHPDETTRLANAVGPNMLPTYRLNRFFASGRTYGVGSVDAEVAAAGLALGVGVGEVCAETEKAAAKNNSPEIKIDLTMRIPPLL